MIKNYFLTAFRILQRQKVYSGVNLLGLTLGIASALLIIIYIVDEWSYDRFHQDASRIYRVSFKARLQEQDIASTTSGAPMAEAMQREIPQVESVVRINIFPTYPLRYEDKSFTEKRMVAADSNFFSFFSFHLIAGNPNEALKGPNKIVLTETAARKYFGYKGAGDLSPIGKIMNLGGDGKQTGVVTGIVEDAPSNSHIKFDVLESMDSWEGAKNPIWLNSSVLTYFKLREGSSLADVDRKLSDFIEKYCGREIQQFLNIDLKTFRSQGGLLEFPTQSMLSIHLHSALRDEIEPNGNIQYVYLFGAIAIFILLLACINFMNLSTARAANRAKEIGVRKTIGALRSRLMTQFLAESFIYTVMGVVLALALVSAVLGPFNVLTGKSLNLNILVHPIFVVALITLTLLVAFVAGSYPAFYLTSFRPAEVLKGKVKAGMKSSGIRNTLVVFQFCISIGLIMATLVVNKQLKLLQQKNLGFEKAHVIDMLHTMSLGKNAEAFRTELLKYPEVVDASYSNRLPPNIDWNSTYMIPGTNQSHLLSIYFMDHHHLNTMGYQMVKGRFFSPDRPSDSSAVILNETAANILGYNDFEGKKIISVGQANTSFEVIGIMKDFNYESLRTSIRPLAMFVGNTPNWEMAIRLTPGDEAAKLARVEEIFKKFAPDSPFEYSFLDQNFDALFRAEQRLSTVITFFTGLAIIIASLGLFGLTTFIAEQRAKEISIRKVLGASAGQLVTLLSRDFTKLVIFGFLLAIPLTWYGVSKWLEEFPYRTTFDPLLVVLAGVSALVVALLTVSFQAIKSAVRNPVDSLKSE